MVYAVIDTNVLVAAAKSHKPDSSASKVLSLVFSGIIQPLVCDEILEEYEGILELPVLAIPKDVSEAILTKFKKDGINPGKHHHPKITLIRQTECFMKYPFLLKMPIW